MNIPQSLLTTIILHTLFACMGDTYVLEPESPTLTEEQTSQNTQTTAERNADETTTTTDECVANRYEYHRFKMKGGLGFLTLDLRIPKGSLELCELEQNTGMRKDKDRQFRCYFAF